MVAHTLFFQVASSNVSCHQFAGARVCQHVKVWRFQWNIVGQYFFTSEILHGLLRTIILTVVAMLTGIVLGITIAVMRLSPNRVLTSVAWVYTWFFRGTPVLVQLLFWSLSRLLVSPPDIGRAVQHLTFVHLTLTPPLTILEGVVSDLD